MMMIAREKIERDFISGHDKFDDDDDCSTPKMANEKLRLMILSVALLLLTNC